jgi:hypothetical protein
MKNSAMVMTIQDPASQRLTWYKPPLTVLVIKKVRDASVHLPFVQLVQWLIEVRIPICLLACGFTLADTLTRYRHVHHYLIFFTFVNMHYLALWLRLRPTVED